MKSLLCHLSAFVCAFSLVFVSHSEGGSATWNSNPTSTDWRVPANWMPATVPNGASDTANFGISAQPQVELFGRSGTFLEETVAKVDFAPGASAYTITAEPHGALSFVGVGVVNESGIQQNFKTETDDLGNIGQFFFAQGASAGSSLNTFTNRQTSSYGGVGGRGGACYFNDGSTAGSALIVNEGGSRLQAGGGEANFFYSSSTAGNATIINGGATDLGATGGLVQFTPGTAGQCVIVNNGAENTGSGGRVLFNGGKGGSAQVTNNGGTVAGAGGGTVSFTFASHAETATIINNGGTVAGAYGGVTTFVDNSRADQAILVANGGTNGGDGGQIVLGENATARDAHFAVNGNGSLDVSSRIGGLKLGPLEGDGLVFLGARNLKLGSRNEAIRFAGTIMDGGIAGGVGGALTKLGRGTLELSGMSTYSGGTAVTSGVLRVTNTTGSATGTGPVTVEGGLLAGFGVIEGEVTLDTSSGLPSTIAPSNGRPRSAALTIQGALTFNSASTYKWAVNNSKAKADELVANGVTISAGAFFSPNLAGIGVLQLGTVFTAISNTSATPINGTFDNLADGATISVGGTNFQASYEGGDGNDLTLTVLP